MSLSIIKFNYIIKFIDALWSQQPQLWIYCRGIEDVIN